jgi:hypothetical protein
VLVETKLPAGAQHTASLGQCLALVGHRAGHGADDHDVGRFGGQLERGGNPRLHSDGDRRVGGRPLGLSAEERPGSGFSISWAIDAPPTPPAGC